MRLLIDLDNTLVDRAGAFVRWTHGFLAELAGAPTADPEQVAWLLDADRDGYTPRAELAEAIIDRYGLPVPVDALVDRLLFEHVRFVEPYPGVVERLRTMDAAVVTNGTVAQQEAKLRHAGLERYLADAVISERIGAKKPDPAVFRAALGGSDPADAWMVGDHPEADIAGARELGLRTAWVSHGRTWMQSWQPTVIAPTTAEALDAIVGN